MKLMTINENFKIDQANAVTIGCDAETYLSFVIAPKIWNGPSLLDKRQRRTARRRIRQGLLIG